MRLTRLASIVAGVAAAMTVSGLALAAPGPAAQGDRLQDQDRLQIHDVLQQMDRDQLQDEDCLQDQQQIHLRISAADQLRIRDRLRDGTGDGQQIRTREQSRLLQSADRDQLRTEDQDQLRLRAC